MEDDFDMFGDESAQQNGEFKLIPLLYTRLSDGLSGMAERRAKLV